MIFSLEFILIKTTVFGFPSKLKHGVTVSSQPDDFTFKYIVFINQC